MTFYANILLFSCRNNDIYTIKILGAIHANLRYYLGVNRYFNPH